MKKRKKPLYYIIWGLLCLVILGISTYPFISDYLLARKQEAAIAQYEKQPRNYLENFYKQPTTKKAVDPFAKQSKTGNNSVNVAASELKTVAVLSIPKIKEVLPVFQGTSQIALDNGVGVLENTPLPVGGKGKHSVLTGHSGLSLNRLFTDLPKLKKGDKFYIKVNHQIHAYRVDQIHTVLPDNLRYFKTDPNKDLVTLVTCTPLFQNTHRLLVRGHRVPYHAEDISQDGGLTSLGKAAIVALIATFLMGLFYWWTHKWKGSMKNAKHAKK